MVRKSAGIHAKSQWVQVLAWGSILGASWLTACGSDSGSGPSDSSTSNLTIKVVPATVLRSTRASTLTAATTCTPSDTSNNNSVTGYCFTPINVRGSFTGATLSRAQGGIPSRILGGGSETGFESVFKRGLFDLATTPSIASSEDNLEDATSTTTYDMLQVNAQVIETVFSAGTSPVKYYHVRTYFVAQPPSTDSAFGSCTFSDGEKSIMDEGGTIYTGSNSGIQAKDILVCETTDSATECAESDYKWVDGSSLSATRPASPKQITTNSIYYTASSCTAGSDHPDMSWGYGQVSFDLDASYSISAAISGGTKTYTYDGTSGTKIEFEVAMDTTESLFFPASSGLATDPANWSESDVLSHINEIQLKPIGWASGQGSSATGSSGGLLGAGLTITVSD